MFGNKKIEREQDLVFTAYNKALAEIKGQNNATAKTLIMEEIEVIKELKNPESQRSYVIGMAYMARELGAITMNEHAAITNLLLKK